MHGCTLVTSGHPVLVHFWRLFWDSHWAVRPPLPVPWTHLFCARINNLKRVFTKGESQLSVCRARLQSSNFGCISSHKLFYMNFTSVFLHLFLFRALCLFFQVYPLFHLLICCSGYPTVLDILCCCAACQEKEIIFFNVCPTTIILPSENRWIC